MNNFKVIVPVYNGERTIEKCLDSIRQQTYECECIVVDDCSTDKTRDIINYIGFAKLSKNDYRKGSAIANIVRGIEEVSKDKDDIIVIVDGDDYLKHNNVLSILNNIYKPGVWLTYGSYEPLSGNIYRANYPLNRIRTVDAVGKEVFISLTAQEYRRSGLWCTSHLRTFRRWLYDKIDNVDLRYEDGEYFRTCCDVCLMFPMIEMADSHIVFVEDILYVYNDVTNTFNDPDIVSENTRNFEYLKNKPIYAKI
jgi:glycosyltransferase involved in cell wall biosynthesis